jgi:hypothetical protein
MLVHPALHPGQPHNRGGRLHHRPLRRHRDQRSLTNGLHPSGGESEPLYRWPHPEGLVRSLSVVVNHRAACNSATVACRRSCSVRNSAPIVLCQRSTFPVVVGDRGAQHTWATPAPSSSALRAAITGP